MILRSCFDSFKAPYYPLDYDMYVSKRCDCYSVEEKLHNRGYQSFKEVIKDIRLIFENGLAYNSNFRGQPINDAVYEAAERMLPILDAKINR